jgi:uncharacterized protein
MPEQKLKKICNFLYEIGPSLVACSGGLDSLLLSVIVHRLFPKQSLIAHATGPAVPQEAAERVRLYARQEGWRLELVTAGEFEDLQYISNPLNRCYFCKSHLYYLLRDYGYEPETGRYGRASDEVFRRTVRELIPYPILSGANIDDLGEYRPGLDAAREAGVRHPFIEAAIGKEDIRDVCRGLQLPFAELATSPCLSSRIYTGTPVRPEWLRLVDTLETELKKTTGVKVVRCRLREKNIWIEALEEDRARFTKELLDDLRVKVRARHPELEGLALDPLPYKPGRAFVKVRNE